MSYESKHIDGDVSVGRNTAIGGDATVQGKTHLKGNVMVDGWLEAKNIKGVSKGLFTTIEKLKAAYPCLLYTSPSPRDAHESRMPSSA